MCLLICAFCFFFLKFGHEFLVILLFFFFFFFGRGICDWNLREKKERKENGVDFGDFHGDGVRDCVDGWMETHDELPKHQANC